MHVAPQPFSPASSQPPGTRQPVHQRGGACFTAGIKSAKRGATRVGIFHLRALLGPAPASADSGGCRRRPQRSSDSWKAFMGNLHLRPIPSHPLTVVLRIAPLLVAAVPSVWGLNRGAGGNSAEIVLKGRVRLNGSCGTRRRRIVRRQGPWTKWTGPLAAGKSQWLSHVDAEQASLNAAHLADQQGVQEVWKNALTDVPG
jgi:hypothetical protein